MEDSRSISSNHVLCKKVVTILSENFPFIMSSVLLYWKCQDQLDMEQNLTIKMSTDNK